jgi:hypothetical protein
MFSGSTAAISGAINGNLISGIPTTIAQSLLLSGSKQWHAELGAYVVGAFNSTDVPKQGVNNIQPVILPTLYTGGNPSAVTMPVVPTHVVAGSVSACTPSPYLWAKHDISVVQFTGLSLQTTINITSLEYIEEFPEPIGSPSLVTLAKCSPCYDPVALELYSFLIREMPVGVPVSENGFGDWIASAVSKVSEFVSPILAAIPHPIAQGASRVLGVAGGVANNYIANERADEARRRAPGPGVLSNGEAKRITATASSSVRPPPRAPRPVAISVGKTKMTPRMVAAMEKLKAKSAARRR